MITMHPGEFLQTAMLEPMNMSQTTLAKHLGVTRGTVSRLLSQQADMSPEMAVRLGLAFGTSAEYWMRMQMLYSLQQVQASFDKAQVTPVDIEAIRLAKLAESLG